MHAMTNTHHTSGTTPPRGRSPFDDARPLVLLAEDDPEIQRALAEFLEVIGYDVIAVDTGSDMLDALGSMAADGGREADIIVTDVRMPGLNGVSIAEELRADGWQQPIVIISAFDDPALLSRVRSISRCAFFAKPLDPALFEKTLADLRRPRWTGPTALHVR